jgi:hypothetical protein
MLSHRPLRTARQVLAVAAGIALVTLGAVSARPDTAAASATGPAALAKAAPTASAPAGGRRSPAGKGSRQQLKIVSYRGYRFRVPRSWPVIRNAQHPTYCVRFDLHAVYLGVPGANQDCPSWLVGATEALLVEPAAAAVKRRSVENPVANEITATAPRIRVTATFDTDPTVIYRILASAGLPAPVIVAANPANPADTAAGAPAPAAGTADDVSASATRRAPGLIFGAAAPALPATVTNEVGVGFDVCAAPSAGYMGAWRRSSPYRAVGIYIGGADRACDQQNLTARWVRSEAAAGWRFIPMYVGPQASFGQLSDPGRQGVAAAADAVQQAERLSFGPQTPIYYDMEAYPAADANAALRFLSAWTTELHKLDYESGVYGSSDSGVADLAKVYRSGRFAMPDAIYDALWNGSKDVRDSAYRPGEWPGRRRLHQYSGNVLQTYGGVTMDVDQDYLDLALTAPGGTNQATPGATQAGAAASVFYEGSDHRLWEESRTAAGSWSRTDLGGQLTSAPSVVAVGRSDLAVLYRGATGELTVQRRTAGRWQPPQRLPMMGVIGGAPRAVAQTNGVIDVFWSGNYDRHLWHGEFNPGQGWSGPQPLQGNLASSPYPVESGTGVVQVFWEGTNRKLWRVTRGVGAGWTRPQDLGMGPMGGAPHAVQLPDGETDVFWRGEVPHSVWSAAITAGGKVTGPHDLGGQTTGAPWPVLAAGHEEVLFRSPRGQLWELVRGRNGRWNRAVRVARASGLAAAPFAAAGGSAAPLHVFWAGRGSALWSMTFTTAGGWQPPADLGGQVR